MFSLQSLWRHKKYDALRQLDIFCPTKTMTYIHLAIGMMVNSLNGGASRPMP